MNEYGHAHAVGLFIHSFIHSFNLDSGQERPTQLIRIINQKRKYVHNGKIICIQRYYLYRLIQTSCCTYLSVLFSFTSYLVLLLLLNEIYGPKPGLPFFQHLG